MTFKVISKPQRFAYHPRIDTVFSIKISHDILRISVVLDMSTN